MEFLLITVGAGIVFNLNLWGLIQATKEHK